MRPSRAEEPAIDDGDRGRPGAARLARRGRGQARSGAGRPAARPTATRARPSTWRRLARLQSRRRSARRRGGGHGADPRRRGRDPRRRRARPRRGRAQARSSAGPSSRPRSSGPSASSPTRASWPRPPRRSSRPSARSSSGCGRSWRRCERPLPLGAGAAASGPRWIRRESRALPALARAVRDALRPGADAAADDRARAARSSSLPRSTSSAPTASPRPSG